MRRSALWGYLLIAATLAGCSQGRDAHRADQLLQQRLADEAKRGGVWEGNRDWLLTKLPRAAQAAHQVTAAFNSYSGSKKLRASEYSMGDYDKLFDVMRGKLSAYRLVRPPEGAGHLALIDGDAAYLFDMVHLEFSGVASLEKALFFAVPDVPLLRSDDRSFAFVANDQTDATTSWTLYRRNILAKDQGGSLNLGTYSLTRAELDNAGAARQIDLLTPQQRGERELAKQGLVWRRRAEMKAAQLCGSQHGARGSSKKQGGHGDRGGMRNRPAANGGTAETTTESAPGPDNTITEPLKGYAPLNCSSGVGYILSDDGIVAEVSDLRRSREGDPNPVISSTSKVITGATMTYSYATESAQGSLLCDQPDRDMVLELKSADGSNRLSLSLRPETGVGRASLVLPGDWYVGPGYKFAGKEISRSEFAAFFIRAYRDCAVKEGQGACKSLPELFVSLLNVSIAQDLVRYIGEQYLNPAGSVEKKGGGF